MTEDELQELADTPPEMTDGEVYAAIAGYGFTPDAIPYTRAEPKEGQDHPGDRVFLFPLPMAGGMFLAVGWCFGEPSDDEMLSWKVRWKYVAGPVTRSELEELARGK